jgi:hypothetical protein
MGVAFCAPVVGEIGNRTGFRANPFLYIEQAIERKKKHKISIVIAKKK